MRPFMGEEPIPIVYVVVEKKSSDNKRVKAVFESESDAKIAIREHFRNDSQYEIVPRSLYESLEKW